jgi:hypothetical protein
MIRNLKNGMKAEEAVMLNLRYCLGICLESMTDTTKVLPEESVFRPISG